MYHGTTSTPPAPLAPPKKPTTLVLAVWGAVAVAVLYIVGAALLITGGRDTINEVLGGEGVDTSSDLVQQLAGDGIDEAYGVLVTKGVVAIVTAVVLLVAALLARGGATWARATVAAVLGLALCTANGWQVAEVDYVPNASLGALMLTFPLTVAVIVLLFLPPTNRYAKERKLATR